VSSNSTSYVEEPKICLIDPVFALYKDDVLELRFNRCRDLIKTERFALDRETCEKFEPLEIVNGVRTRFNPVDRTLFFDGNDPRSYRENQPRLRGGACSNAN